MSRMRYSLLLFAVLSASGRGKLDYNDLSNMSLEELMSVEVTSASRYAQKLAEAPASMIIITHDQIIDNGYFDLSDILKDIPGIDIVDHARGFGEFYTVRGIEGNDRFLVLLDGQKLNPVSGTFLSVGNSISIRFAERVEILLGPGSVVYGADAFAGVISISNNHELANNSVQAYANSGSQSAIDAGLYLSKSLSKNISINASARIFQSDGPDFTDRDSIYSHIQNYPAPLSNHFEQPLDDYNLHLNAHYKEVSLTWYRQHFDEGNALGTHPKSNIYNQANRWNLTSDVVWSEFQHQLSRGREISAAFAWVRHLQDPETQFLKTKTAYDFSETFSQYLTGEDRTWRGVFNFHHILNPEIQFLAGVEFESTQSIPPYANDQGFKMPVKYEGEHAKQIADKLSIEEFRQADYIQVTFKPQKKLFINGGLRYDYSNRYGGTFNPRLGFTLKAQQKTSIKAIYGTAFQAPSLFYQYEQWGGATDVMLSVDEIKVLEPDWALNNQKIRTIEAEFDHHVNDYFHLNLSVYNHQLRDLIERIIYTDNAFNKYFSTEDTTVYSRGHRNENNGIQDVLGLILEVQSWFGPHSHGYINYAFTKATITKDGVASGIPRVAEHKVLLGFKFSKLWNYLTVSPRLKWVGDINNQNSTVFPSGKQPGYTTLDLSLSVNNLWKYTRIFARFENILNTDIEHGGLYNQVSYLPTAYQPGFISRAGVEFSIH